MRKCILIFAACLPALLFAQQRLDTTHIYSIPEVTVSDSYRITDLRNAVPTQTLSQQQLQQLNALQLSDAVKHFSGVIVKDYGGIGGLKTVSIRSLGAEHTGISYDGIALTDYQTGQIDIGRFSLDNVDHVSLSIGQTNQIFQPARLFASAAVLNIASLTPVFSSRDCLHGFASFKTGSWGLVNPSVHVERKLDNRWAVTANAEWMSSDGKYPFTLYYANDGLSSHEKRNNTDVRNLRLETELFGNFTQKEQFRFKLYYYDSSRGLPGATTYYYNHSSQHLWDKNFFAQAHYQKELTPKWVIQTSAKWNWSYQHYLDPDYNNIEGKTENSYFQQEYYLSESVLYRAFDKLSFSLSSDESLNKLNANLSDFAFPSRFTWLSAVAAKYADTFLTATASMLSTCTSESVKSGTAAANQRRLSPFVSLSVRPCTSKDFVIRFFYKDIFRLPTFNDLYYTSIGYTGLKPERASQFNGGITYSQKISAVLSMFTLSVDAFYNKVHDKIIAVPTKNLFVWSMTNLGKVDMKGMDVNASLNVKLAPKWLVDLSGNCSYLRALDKTDSEGKTYNQQIAYTPRFSASGLCSIQSPWVTLGCDLIYSGKRYMLGQNIASNRLNSYTDCSLSARRSFKLRKVSYTLAAELLNVMNKNYEIVKNFPMPGRSFRILLNVKL